MELSMDIDDVIMEWIRDLEYYRGYYTRTDDYNKPPGAVEFIIEKNGTNSPMLVSGKGTTIYVLSVVGTQEIDVHEPDSKEKLLTIIRDFYLML